ncbi:MAG: hypothetical protein DWH91_12115 [Planctomycetota bacterium]|nr:MAG: hypothetical protein DWH91_12115 [Planctomycetota bacterium]
MATLTAYRGLQVVTPNPTGDGGLAIQNDLKSLVDWSPKSVWAQSADPTAGDDQTGNYFPGSLWLRTDVSPPKLFVCQSSATGAAVWKQVLLQVVQDAAPQLGGNLDVNGKQIVSVSNGNIPIMPQGTGKVGVGVASPHTLLQVAGPVATPIATKTSLYPITGSDSVVIADATTAAFNVTLPTAVGISGRQYTIKRVNGGVNNVTVTTTSSQTIDGATTNVLNAQYSSVTVVSDGANWLIV